MGRNYDWSTKAWQSNLIRKFYFATLGCTYARAAEFFFQAYIEWPLQNGFRYGLYIFYTPNPKHAKTTKIHLNFDWLPS